jgi:hypothetical protein
MSTPRSKSHESYLAQVLQRHTIDVKGLAGCSINTLAPVGTVFVIPFWVSLHLLCIAYGLAFFCSQIRGASI